MLASRVSREAPVAVVALMPISLISETPPAPVCRNCRSTRRYGNDHHRIRDLLVVREVRPCVGNAQGQASRESKKCPNRVSSP